MSVSVGCGPTIQTGSTATRSHSPTKAGSSESPTAAAERPPAKAGQSEGHLEFLQPQLETARVAPAGSTQNRYELREVKSRQPPVRPADRSRGSRGPPRTPGYAGPTCCRGHGAQEAGLGGAGDWQEAGDGRLISSLGSDPEMRWTRMSGGVGAGRSILPATRLAPVVMPFSNLLPDNPALAAQLRAQSCQACCSQRSKELPVANLVRTTRSVWPGDTRSGCDANMTRQAQSDSKCGSDIRVWVPAKLPRDTGSGRTARARRDTREVRQNACSNNSQLCLCRWAYA